MDESRPITKVPGLNVYLELFGCMDEISPEDIDWEGPNGAYATLTRMSLWAQNIYDRENRVLCASRIQDTQIIPEWVEQYDETLRDSMPPKRGIGIYPYVDASRREDSLYVHVPRFAKTDAKEAKRKKERLFEDAARGKRVK